MNLEPRELFRYGAYLHVERGEGPVSYSHKWGYSRKTDLPPLSGVPKEFNRGRPGQSPIGKMVPLYLDALARATPPSLKRRREFVWQRQSEEVYRALRISREAMGFGSAALNRAWRAIPHLCYVCPTEVARLSKVLAHDLRVYSFTGVWTHRPHLLWRVFKPKNRKMGLQGSHLGRALPAPAVVREDALIKEYVDRVLKPPDVPLADEFSAWLEDYMRFFRPKAIPTHLDISISHNASLEDPREEGWGGAARAIPSLIERGKKSKRYPAWLRGRLSEATNGPAIGECSRKEAAHHKELTYLLLGCVDALGPFIDHSKVCDPKTCKQRGKHPRVCPTIILEKGNKTRIPTVTSAPEQILASIYRSAAQFWLDSDPRTRSSQRGELRLPGKARPGEYYRSQDLTTATDMHSFDLTRKYYEEMKKYINTPTWWSDVIRVITGPHEVIDPDGLEYIRVILPKHDFEYSCYPVGPVTKRGQHMGTATSWPLLPVYTIFAFERSSPQPLKTYWRNVHPTWRVPGPCFTPDGKIVTRVRRGPSGEQRALALSEKSLPTEILARVAPEGSYRIDTTGDDAIGLVTLEHSVGHTQSLLGIGSEVSKNKDFLSDTYGVYTEVLLEDGAPVGVPSLGPLCCNHGVREPTWDSFSAAFRDNVKKNAVSETRAKRLYRSARFHPLIEALEHMGARTSYPLKAGGLLTYSHRENPTRAIGGLASYLANLPSEAACRYLGYHEYDMPMDLFPRVPSVAKSYDVGPMMSVKAPKEKTAAVLYIDTQQLFAASLAPQRYSQIMRDTPPDEPKKLTPLRYLREMWSTANGNYTDPRPTVERLERIYHRSVHVSWATMCQDFRPSFSLGPVCAPMPLLVLTDSEYRTVILTPGESSGEG